MLHLSEYFGVKANDHNRVEPLEGNDIGPMFLSSLGRDPVRLQYAFQFFSQIFDVRMLDVIHLSVQFAESVSIKGADQFLESFYTGGEVAENHQVPAWVGHDISPRRDKWLKHLGNLFG
jgi:hypothetical protein